jgi:hypothetical protein
MSMSALPSAFRSPKGVAEYMTGYQTSKQLWPVAHEPIGITGR